MPECEYCGASHDSEEAHLKHLKAEHADELGPIDKRRVGDVGGDDGSLPTGPLALGVVLLLSIGIIGYVVFIAGGSGADGVGQAGSAHYHGTMEMTVLDEEVDFSQDQYQVQDQRFHFEGGEGTRWHAHATGVTFEYGMEALGFEVDRSPNTLVYEGETYVDGDGYEVVLEINGEAVTDLGYTLKEGDSIRIVVREA